MILKKIQGKNVDEARDEARRLYGEHVVVMETFAGNGKNEPASVTVLVDKPVRERTVTDATPPGNFRNVFYKRSDIARVRRNMPEVDFSARTGGGDGVERSGRENDGADAAPGRKGAEPMQRSERTNPMQPSERAEPMQQSASQDSDEQIQFRRTERGQPDETVQFKRPARPSSRQESGQTLRSASVASGNTGTAWFMPEEPMPTRFEPRPQGTSRLEALRRYASETDTSESKRLLDHKPQSQRFQFNAGSDIPAVDRHTPTSQPGASPRFGANVATHHTETDNTPDLHNAQNRSSSPVDLSSQDDEVPNRRAAQSDDNRSSEPSPQNIRSQRDPRATKASESAHNELPLAEPRGTGSALESIRNTALRGQEEQSRREIAALHKRFDRLESLLDNNLVAADIDLVAHPAFQQLTQSGIRPALVSRWFSGIIKKGVHPADQPERFLNELSLVVRNALEKQTDKPASPIQVFVGAAGAGKTNLVMLLALYARRHGKNVAIVAVQPPGDAPYYSVLELFCSSEEMSFIRSSSEQGILELQENMQDFDMVLVDTPSLPMSKDKAWRSVWSLRQQWSVPGVKGSPNGPVTQDIPPLPAEINYVANAATGASALNYLTSLHHTLEPDVVSFTHLDEITLWGSIIPFMDEMNAPCRYLSAGTDEENGIRPYDATEVARNILKDS
ncbi:MAG: hypothetical protein JJU41_09825 [Bacteroidetes bacterium]|nr:hypothetical protein [Bacteroidota bacterium]